MAVKKLDFDKLNSVLIRGTNWIGDVVMTFPAIAAVRKTLPRARITVLVKPWVADLVRMHPAVDEVMIYERPGLHEGWMALALPLFSPWPPTTGRWPRRAASALTASR